MSTEKYVPMTAADLPQNLIDEALAISRRYDRNLANKDGTEVFPVPCRTARLMAMTIINLNEKLQSSGSQMVGSPIPAAPEKQGKAVAHKSGAKTGKRKKNAPAAKKTGKKPPSGMVPPMTAEQKSAYEAVKDILHGKQVVTARGVAKLCGWASHNTAARHINSLIDLGYLKRVGKQEVLVLTGQKP